VITVRTRKPKSIASDYAEAILNVFGVAARRMLRLMEPVTIRYSLGPRGASMLTLIERGAVHPAQLAEIYEVGRSLMTAEIARLTAAGLVTREEFDRDKRRAALTLTPLGKQVSADCFGAYRQTIQSALGHYTPAERALFLAMLQDLGSGPQPANVPGSPVPG